MTPAVPRHKQTNKKQDTETHSSDSARFASCATGEGRAGTVLAQAREASSWRILQRYPDADVNVERETDTDTDTDTDPGDGAEVQSFLPLTLPFSSLAVAGLVAAALMFPLHSSPLLSPLFYSRLIIRLAPLRFPP